MPPTGARSFVWYSRGAQKGKTMGASSSHPFIISESLELRRLLSAATIESAPLSIPTSLVFTAPGVHFSGIAQIANNVGSFGRNQRDVPGSQGGAASMGFAATATATVTFSVIAGNNPDSIPLIIDSSAGGYQNGSDGASADERGAFWASLAAGNGVTDGANSSVPPGASPPPVTGNGNVPAPSRGQGNGKGVVPGVLHPGESDGSGTSPTGSDGPAGDGLGGSTGSGGQGSGGSQHAHPPQGHVLVSTVVEGAAPTVPPPMKMMRHLINLLRFRLRQ